MKAQRIKLLSGPQRGTLSAIAHEAFKRLAPGLRETFDEFRKGEARQATRKLEGAPQDGWTISEAPASAFNVLFAHFQALKGNTGVALDYLTGPSAEMRNHLHNITVAERAAGVTPAYTAAICRRMGYGDAPQTDAQALAVLAALGKKARKSAGEEVEA